MSGQNDAIMTDAPVWFCAGNVDERFTTLAMESLLMELAATGKSPLAVYTDSPPFSSSAVKAASRDKLDRLLERYTGASIPAVRLGVLREYLSVARQRNLLTAEGARFGAVLIRGSGMPEKGLPTPADGVLLLAARGSATSGWIYQAVRNLAARTKDTPVCLVVVNATHLEEAAVFFQNTREEITALLRRDIPLHFGGYLKFDPDYAGAALDAGRSMVEYFPGSPFHGQIRYVVRALLKAFPPTPRESYFSRLFAWKEGLEQEP